MYRLWEVCLIITPSPQKIHLWCFLFVWCNIFSSTVPETTCPPGGLIRLRATRFCVRIAQSWQYPGRFCIKPEFQNTRSWAGEYYHSDKWLMRITFEPILSHFRRYWREMIFGCRHLCVCLCVHVHKSWRPTWCVCPIVWLVFAPRMSLPPH